MGYLPLVDHVHTGNTVSVYQCTDEKKMKPRGTDETKMSRARVVCVCQEMEQFIEPNLSASVFGWNRCACLLVSLGLLVSAPCWPLLVCVCVCLCFVDAGLVTM